jgi:hypothetical protein
LSTFSPSSQATTIEKTLKTFKSDKKKRQRRLQKNKLKLWKRLKVRRLKDGKKEINLRMMMHFLWQKT